MPLLFMKVQEGFVPGGGERAGRGEESHPAGTGLAAQVRGEGVQSVRKVRGPDQETDQE